MSDVHVTNTRSNATRYVVGIGSLLACAGPILHLVLRVQLQLAQLERPPRDQGSIGIVIPHPSSGPESTQPEIDYLARFGLVTHLSDTAMLIFLLVSLLGHLLLADFCLRRWAAVGHREGARACNTVVGAALAVGLAGALVTIGSVGMLIPGVLYLEWLAAIGVHFGFWVLWAFVLASVIRKLRRMMRAANAE